MKPLSHVTDPRMVTALSHPLRVRILAALEHRTASPSELAEQFGVPVANVSYHVRKLEALGVIKLEREARRRGAVEHYYRIETRPSVRGEAWEGTPEVVREAFLSAMLGNISTQVNQAAAEGGFGTDSHVSRLPLTLDQKGYRELAGILEKLVERVKGVEERSRARLAKADHEGETHALAVLMLFEAAGQNGSARPAKAKPAARRRRKRAVPG